MKTPDQIFIRVTDDEWAAFKAYWDEKLPAIKSAGSVALHLILTHPDVAALRQTPGAMETLTPTTD